MMIDSKIFINRDPQFVYPYAKFNVHLQPAVAMKNNLNNQDFLLFFFFINEKKSTLYLYKF